MELCEWVEQNEAKIKNLQECAMEISARVGLLECVEVNVPGPVLLGPGSPEERPDVGLPIQCEARSCRALDQQVREDSTIDSPEDCLS